MSKIISIANFKGGTSKTTTAINLATAFSKLFFKVLVIDLDAQANLSQSFGIEDGSDTISDVFSKRIDHLPIKKINEYLHVVPSSFSLSESESSLYSNVNSYFIIKTQIDRVKNSYDIVLIDLAPSIGIYTQNALIASDSVLITVQAQYLSLRGLDTIYHLILSIRERLNTSIKIEGVVVTQTNHTRLSKDIEASLREDFNGTVYKTTIRQNVAIAEASALRKDVFSHSPYSHGAKDYMSLAQEINL